MGVCYVCMVLGYWGVDTVMYTLGARQGTYDFDWDGYGGVLES